MIIDTVGIKVKTSKRILEIGKDYLIRRGFHGISAAKLVGIHSSSQKYSRDHFLFKSYRTGRIVTLKSDSNIF